MVCHHVKALDIITWDEASMSSRRMLELVNVTHHELAEGLSPMYLFAGKQMIIVGEFLQLQPVLKMFEEGCCMIKTPLFDFAISHRFGLTKFMWQSQEHIANV